MARKHKKREKINIKLKNNKTIFLVLVCVILIIASIGITSALVLTKSEPKENTYIPGNISCEVQENYSIKNTGNTEAYIRADVIVNWVDSNGNIYAIIPEYTITLGTDWEKSTQDGYYYYTKQVNAQESTTEIISEITNTSEAPEGYSLSVTILAEAIQAGDNQKAIKDAWGVEM